MSLWAGLPLSFVIHSKRANPAKQKQGVTIARIVKWEPLLSLLSHSLWCNKGGLCVAGGWGDICQKPSGETTCSATDSPWGPHILPRTVGGGGGGGGEGPVEV